MPDRPSAYDHAVNQHDVEQIAQVVANLGAGMNSNDVDLIDRQFTDDVLWVTASGTRLLVWYEMNAHHRQGLDDPPLDLRVTWTMLGIYFLGPDVAVADTKQDYLTPETGTKHGTAVLIKKNQTWWICSMQHTNVVS
ncbi:SgcJ/EcaC family oxidoreductase [Chelativorans salis]|uniref:SgcJ/EcaC family oxidoreductase n=1 Tax=Chelativorans salis TaxID=2978478 RepID=A0ABT2LSY5_9HYPH|nr:SgcJ/EcaC family oxidoreductase [Chelativorans sp. EGI FJ00035]MCT7376294.1 SgcJ/EcaC family oxidoreductase [Chelativorans sp. EGI FJ00035]